MTKFLTKAAIAATVATSFFAAPAMAAPGDDEADFTATATIVKPLLLTKVRDLDFGTIVMQPALTSQDVSITNNVGDCGGANLTCTFPTDPGAYFTVAGVGSQTLTVDVVPPATLDLVGDTTKTVAFTLDAPGTTDLVDGVGAFDIGGTVTVAATTVEGTYSADMTVTVSYN